MRYSFFLLFLPLFTFAKPPITHIKGIEELVKAYGTDLVAYSPLRGVAAVETSFLKNLWLLGNQNDATVNVVKTLFHVNPGGEFDATTYEPYSHFSPDTIAVLCAGLCDGSLATKDSSGMYRVVYSIKQSFKGGKSPRRLQSLVERVVTAQTEELVRYPLGTTARILLGFLYQKSVKKEDLAWYVTTLASRLGREYVPRNQVWLDDIWADEEHKPFIAWLETTSDPEQSCDADYALYSFVKHKQQSNARPAMILWEREVPYSPTQKIADCCENTLRSFFNELLYNKQTKQFDLTRLTHVSDRACSAFIDFYTTYCNASHQEVINVAQARIDWLHLVSNIGGAQYRQEGFEVHPSIANFVHIIALLLGIKVDTTLDSFEQFRQLCTLLSNDVYSLTLEKSFGNDIHGSVVLCLTNHQKGEPSVEHRFSLNVHIDHAWISRDDWLADYDATARMHQGVEQPNNKCRLGQQLSQQLEGSDYVLDLALCYAPYLQTGKISVLQTAAVLFALPADLEEQKYRLFRRWFTGKHIFDETDFNFLAQWLAYTHETYFKQKALTACIERGLAERESVISLVQQHTSKLEPYDQQRIMMALAQKELWRNERYRKVMLTVLPTIPDVEKDDHGLTIDNRCLVIQRLFRLGAYEDNEIASQIDFLIAQSAPERQTRIKNLIRYSTTKHNHQP